MIAAWRVPQEEKKPKYISRDAAIALAKDIVVPTKDGGIYRHRCIDLDDIRGLPAADVREVKRGKWEYDSDGLPVCSECGEIALQRMFVKVPHLIQDVRMVHSNFCPNCGARMEES